MSRVTSLTCKAGFSHWTPNDKLKKSYNFVWDIVIWTIDS